MVGQLIGTAIAMIILLQHALIDYAGLVYVAMTAFGITLLVSFFVVFRIPFRGDDSPHRPPGSLTAAGPRWPRRSRPACGNSIPSRC